MLNKEDCLFERDEEGKLLGRTVTLEKLPNKPTIKIRPLTRGKLMSIYSMAQSENQEEKTKADIDVIKAGLIEPILTEEELEFLKPAMVGAMSIAIMSLSLGISQDDVGKTMTDIEKQELELKK